MATVGPGLVRHMVYRQDVRARAGGAMHLNSCLSLSRRSLPPCQQSSRRQFDSTRMEHSLRGLKAWLLISLDHLLRLKDLGE